MSAFASHTFHPIILGLCRRKNGMNTQIVEDVPKWLRVGLYQRVELRCKY